MAHSGQGTASPPHASVLRGALSVWGRDQASTEPGAACPLPSVSTLSRRGRHADEEPRRTSRPTQGRGWVEQGAGEGAASEATVAAAQARALLHPKSTCYCESERPQHSPPAPKVGLGLRVVKGHSASAMTVSTSLAFKVRGTPLSARFSIAALNSAHSTSAG